jgi:hypothetical protein
MLPARKAPVAADVCLPWGEPADVWGVALVALLDGLAPDPRRGSYNVRHSGGRYGAKVHTPLFRQQSRTHSYVLPSEDLLTRLASRPLLELGAGSGAMALMVAAAGGDVIATDPCP